MTGVTIEPVRDDTHAGHVATLVWQFLDHLRMRYPERVQDIDEYVAYQDVDGQLRNWRDTFLPPLGECLLALMDDVPVGTVMLRRLDDTSCEMNRMYVTGPARGHKVGRRLGETLIARAKEMGFASMRLDAWDRHEEALPLYTALGFEREWDAGLKPASMSHEMIHMRRTL
jgi:GNAT superfamily N-acetyltransferase